MESNTSRAMPDRTGSTVVVSLVLGALLAYAVLFGWYRLRLSVPQRHALPVYARVLIPLPRTVSLRALQPILPVRISPLDHRVVDRATVQRLIANQFFEGHSLFNVLRLPLGIAGLLLLASLIIGVALRAQQVRRLRDGIKLRGPDLITPRQFNRQTKGDGLVIKLAK